MITVRLLTPADFAKATEIDVTESGSLIHRQVGEELTEETKAWSRRPWSPERYQQLIETWADILKANGAVLGAFDGDRLVGEAAWRPRLTETMSQLESLHISAACRRQGVARQLVTEVIRLARESGATQLYVSGTPTPSAVGFYRRMGFAPTATPHPALLALEPEDIHMTMSLV
ncbi:MAG TPA: GNAT family N-acetyltransferase [Symbiobacteriaceae bacterium]|jgi:ribosomal protein S18 acetylase RimI-like enzyme|nr:GNAT family N-acetyltransferase [Symbiobacteriaceae bacterium]